MATALERPGGISAETQTEASRKADFWQGLQLLAILGTITYGAVATNQRILDNVMNERVESQRTHLAQLELKPEDIPDRLRDSSRYANIWNNENPIVVVKGNEWHSRDFLGCTVNVEYVQALDHDHDPATPPKALAVVSSIKHCFNKMGNRITINDSKGKPVTGKIIKTTVLNEDFPEPPVIALVEFPNFYTIINLAGNFNFSELTEKDMKEPLMVCGRPDAVDNKSLCETVSINRFQDGAALLNMIGTPADSGAIVIDHNNKAKCIVQGNYNVYDPHSPVVCSLISKTEYKNVSDLFIYGRDPKNIIVDNKQGKKLFTPKYNEYRHKNTKPISAQSRLLF